MTETGRRITYNGEPAFASALVQELEKRDVRVDWTRPREQRGVSEAAETVMLSLLAWGSQEAIRAGIAAFRRRLPHVEVDLEDDEQDD